MSYYFIKKGNIGLRQICVDDKEKFLYWHNNAEMRRRIGGIFPFDETIFYKICSDSIGEQPSDIWFAICKEERLIGIAGLHSIKYIQRNAEVALLLDFIEQNQGIGSTVLTMMEEYAFGELNLHRLYAFVYSDNQIAKKFFQTNEWNKEGELVDASYWNYQFRNVLIFAKLYL